MPDDVATMPETPPEARRCTRCGGAIAGPATLVKVGGDAPGLLAGVSVVYELCPGCWSGLAAYLRDRPEGGAS